jgi:hypothetical protein
MKSLQDAMAQMERAIADLGETIGKLERLNPTSKPAQTQVDPEWQYKMRDALGSSWYPTHHQLVVQASIPWLTEISPGMKANLWNFKVTEIQRYTGLEPIITIDISDVIKAYEEHRKQIAPVDPVKTWADKVYGFLVGIPNYQSGDQNSDGLCNEYEKIHK